MNQDTEPVHIGATELGRYRHVCAFFNSLDDEYDVLLPFIEEGIEQGQRAIHIISSSVITDHLCRLGVAGIDAHHAEETGQLQIVRSEDAYLRNGHFDQEAMLSTIEEILLEGKQQGYPLTRLVGRMEWASEDLPGVNDYIEYEARLNDIIPKYDDVVVCVYDLSKFNAGVIIDVLRTHPMVIIGRVLQYNPFYVAPDVFVKELRSRSHSESSDD